MDQKERQFTLPHDKLKMCNDKELALWIRRLRNTFLSEDESLSKRTYDDHTLDIADEDTDDSNELGDGGRGLKESDDTDIIDDTVTGNVRDTCGKEYTVTTRAGMKIKKPAHLKDYSCYFVLFLLCQTGIVFILTDVIYLSKVVTLLWFLSMLPYILSVVYYSQELSMSDFGGKALFVPHYEEDMKDDTPPKLCMSKPKKLLGRKCPLCIGQQLLNHMFCEHIYLQVGTLGL